MAISKKELVFGFCNVPNVYLYYTLYRRTVLTVGICAVHKVWISSSVGFVRGPQTRNMLIPKVRMYTE